MELFSAPFFVSFSLTLICGFIVSPVLGTLFIPAHKIEKVGRKIGSLYSLLASSIHSVVTFSLAAYILLTSSTLNSDRAHGLDDQVFVLFQIVLGYVTADLIFCLTDSYLRTEYATLVHHMAMVTGLSLCMYYKHFTFFVVYRGISEFSTPFVNLHMVLYEVGNKNGWMYYFSSIAMMVAFFVARVALIPWHTYALFVTLIEAGDSVRTILKLVMIVNFVAFDILNVYWCFKIIRGGYKFICGKKRMKLVVE